MIIAGTPKQVIAKLRILLEETRPGIFGFWGNDGTVSHQDAKTCIRLLGQEVFPAVREMAKELDLKSPFETESAGQRSVYPRCRAGGSGITSRVRSDWPKLPPLTRSQRNPLPRCRGSRASLSALWPKPAHGRGASPGLRHFSFYRKK